jgi:hypothetical protein
MRENRTSGLKRAEAALAPPLLDCHSVENTSVAMRPSSWIEIHHRWFDPTFSRRTDRAPNPRRRRTESRDLSRVALGETGSGPGTIASATEFREGLSQFPVTIAAISS